MEDRVHFETPEDVDLAFDLAGPASRMAAAIVDHAVIGVLMLAAAAVLITGGIVAIDLADLSSWDAMAEVGAFGAAVLFFVFSFINVTYFLASEWFLGGQSLGKRLFHLRVVREGGYALNFGASFLRNVARLVDILPGTYLVGLFSVLLSARRKRLGDLIAGTIVVRHGRDKIPTARFVGKTYAGLENRIFSITKSQVARLDADTLELLDGYFDRADAIAPQYREKLTRDVANGIAKRMELDLSARPLSDLEALLYETYLALREKLQLG